MRVILISRSDGNVMTLGPCSFDHRILYDLVTHVHEGDDLESVAIGLFEHPEVAEVYGRNVSGGCFVFVGRRN